MNGHGTVGIVIIKIITIIIIVYRSRLCFRLQLPTELRSGRHPAADRSQDEQDNQHIRASHIFHLFSYLLFYDIPSPKYRPLPHIHLPVADRAKNVCSSLLFETHSIHACMYGVPYTSCIINIMRLPVSMFCVY